jgi:hypothetical protein
MCLTKGAFVGEKNLDVIKMHGTTIKKKWCYFYVLNFQSCFSVLTKQQRAENACTLRLVGVNESIRTEQNTVYAYEP